MIIIGEKINASLPGVKRIIAERDENGLRDLARVQAEAGAEYIDVNVGLGEGSREDEARAMRWAVEAVLQAVTNPLVIDSADPSVLAAGLEARGERPVMLNSVKAEPGLLDEVVPLAVAHRAELVGLAMDGGGIPATAEERLRACAEITRACARHGFPLTRLFLDPLVLPVSTDPKHGQVTLETVRGIKREFPGVRTILAVSNVSFGLPERFRLNRGFLLMALSAGLDAAILDPLNPVLRKALRTGLALIGKDRHCRRYIRTFHREKMLEGS